jgi:hypothetical protein
MQGNSKNIMKNNQEIYWYELTVHVISAPSLSRIKIDKKTAQLCPSEYGLNNWLGQKKYYSASGGVEIWFIGVIWSFGTIMGCAALVRPVNFEIWENPFQCLFVPRYSNFALWNFLLANTGNSCKCDTPMIYLNEQLFIYNITESTEMEKILFGF